MSAAPMPPPLSPPQGLRAQIVAKIAQTPASTIPVRRRVLLASVVPVICTAAWIALAMRPDAAVLPRAPLIVSTGATLVLACVALRMSATQTRRGLGARIEALLAIAIAAAPVFAIATMLFPVASPIVAPVAMGMLEGAMRCARSEVALSLISFAALVVALRRSVPAAARARGAALGAAAGAWGGLALHLHCISSDRAHILIGHVLPIAVLAAFGAVVGPRVLRV